MPVPRPDAQACALHFLCRFLRDRETGREHNKRKQKRPDYVNKQEQKEKAKRRKTEQEERKVKTETETRTGKKDKRDGDADEEAEGWTGVIDVKTEARNEKFERYYQVCFFLLAFSRALHWCEWLCC